MSTPRTSDPAFSRALDAARMGHAPGFEWLWNRFSRQVSVFAAAQGSGDPEGITNDVFLGAFGRVDTFFGNEDGFVSLLFSITRNKLVDERRKRSRQVRTADGGLTDEPSGGDVENDALQSLGAEAAALLEGLTDEQREVLHLRLIADLSIEQTALVTGRSINAVKALQHRATHSLRRTISEEAVTK
jgi:RNA polymerase sigma-70 factor (ECF subfamily)